MDDLEIAVGKLAIEVATSDLDAHPPPPRDRSKSLVTKYVVGRVKGASLVIRPNDHDPPHFHVDFGGEVGKAAYLISTGQRYEGDLPGHVDYKVREWAGENRLLLEKAWRDNRPTDRKYRL